MGLIAEAVESGRDESSQRDTREDHGQHHGKNQAGAVVAEQQEPEPDHLECEHDRAGQERDAQIAVTPRGKIWRRDKRIVRCDIGLERPR